MKQEAMFQKSWTYFIDTGIIIEYMENKEYIE